MVYCTNVFFFSFFLGLFVFVSRPRFRFLFARNSGVCPPSLRSGPDQQHESSGRNPNPTPNPSYTHNDTHIRKRIHQISFEFLVFHSIRSMPPRKRTRGTAIETEKVEEVDEPKRGKKKTKHENDTHDVKVKGRRRRRRR